MNTIKTFASKVWSAPYVLFLLYRLSLSYLLDLRFWGRMWIEERGDVNTTSILQDAKVVYGAMQDQINSKAIILNLFGDGSKMGTPINNIGIRGWTFLARLARNFNMGFRAEYDGVGSQSGNQGVGPAGVTGIQQGTVALKYEYVPTVITGQAENLTKGASRAFMQAKALEAKFDMLDVMHHTNVVIAGAERGGQLAQAASPSSGQFTADNAGNLPGALYLVVGMPIDIGPVGGGANSVTGATISAINYSTRVVNFTGGTGTTPNAGDAVYLHNEAPLTTGAFPLTCECLNSLIAATGAIEGLDPSVSGQTAWQSFVSTPGAVDISPALLTELRQFVTNRGGEQTDCFLVPSAQINKYVSIATATLRYDVVGPGAAIGKKALDLGFGVYNFGGIPMIEDKDLRPDRVFCGAADTMKKFEALPLSMADDEAGTWTRITGSNGVADAVSGLLRWYFQIGIIQRSAWGVMKGLNAPADFLTLPPTL